MKYNFIQSCVLGLISPDEVYDYLLQKDINL